MEIDSTVVPCPVGRGVHYSRPGVFASLTVSCEELSPKCVSSSLGPRPPMRDCPAPRGEASTLSCKISGLPVGDPFTRLATPAAACGGERPATRPSASVASHLHGSGPLGRAAAPPIPHPPPIHRPPPQGAAVWSIRPRARPPRHRSVSAVLPLWLSPPGLLLLLRHAPPVPAGLLGAVRLTLLGSGLVAVVSQWANPPVGATSSGVTTTPQLSTALASLAVA